MTIPFRYRTVARLLVPFLLGFAVSTSAFAQTENTAPLPATEGLPASSGSIQKPYQRLHFPKTFGLNHTVIEAFEYGCPYCQKLNAPLIAWARTLPQPFRFTQMPVLISKKYTAMTVATFTVYQADPALLQTFETNAFREVLDYKRPLDNFRVYLRAAYDSGIPYQPFVNALKSPETRALVIEDAHIMRIANITHTPTLIICGRYAINPGDTKGNDGMFIKLANALISRCEYDKGAN